MYILYRYDFLFVLKASKVKLGEYVVFMNDFLRKFYGRYGDLTKQYEVPLSRMLHDILDDDHIR